MQSQGDSNQQHQQQQQQQQPQNASSFPLPPEYYTRFTKENVDKVEGMDEQAIKDDPELHCLRPPPVIEGNQYMMFGRTWMVEDKFPSLEEQGIERLYSKDEPVDRVMELKKLNMKLVFTYLDIIDQLTKEPANFGPQVEKLRTIFINMNHLINEYRPHQAKETLKLLMQNQIEKKQDLTQRLSRQCDELEKALGTLGQSISTQTKSIESTTGIDIFGSGEGDMDVDTQASPESSNTWLADQRSRLFAQLQTSLQPSS